MLPQVYGFPGPIAESPLSEIMLKPQHRVIDLRNADDFNRWHLPGAINLPLNSIGPHTASPFSDPEVLEAQWVELEQIFSAERLVGELGAHHVLAVCYDGDTARVATSVLRAKGLEADSVRGGHHAMERYGIGRGIGVNIGDESAVPAKVPIAAAVSVTSVPLD